MAEQEAQEIIKKAIEGDMDAFRLIVLKNQAFAYSVSYRFLGNAEDSEDVVQEAFIRLWKNMARYKPEIKLTTWLYRIVVNLCLDLLKSTYQRQRKIQVSEEYAANNSVSSDASVLANELNGFILMAANDLTPKQKAVFILRDLEDLPVEEVCDILSISAGNLKSNLYYARQRMSAKLKMYYQTTDKITMI
ncbi:MAG: RNA polymerase sigma factor [Bacteroidia bacterium]|nr:RNA polymerase sigma factor [Bacteroidia bacterium]